MKSPTNIKEVHALNNKLAALTRFISMLVDKFAPFFYTLKNNKTFEWTNECEEAFTKLKTYLATPPILTRLELGETLYLYLAASHKAISTILIREDNGNQKLVYFTSRTLQGAEARYQRLEKITLTLVSTTRKLKPYF